MKSIKRLLFFLITIFTVATVNAQVKGFKTDEVTGVQYRFIKHDKDGTKPPENDIARIAMLWTGKNSKGDADTVFRNSHVTGFGDSLGTISVPLKTLFKGCLEQGIMMMAKGDSAIFLVNADSLFLKAFRFPPDKVPAFVKSNHLFTFNIKLVSFETKDEMMAEKKAARQKMMEKGKTQEPIDITAYLQKNYPTAKPDADSIFYLQTTKGKGAQVKEGDSLVVKYSGNFLDGKVFDPGTRPLPLVYSKNAPVIKGWISVLGNMHEGDKVKVLIPSKMGYGSQGRNPIQPYTPLIFDMELISLKSPK